MYTNSFPPDFEAEVSDTAFDELFETETDQHFSKNKDNIYFDDDSTFHVQGNENIIESIAQELSDQVDGLSYEDAYGYAVEAWPALIPLVKVLAPLAIQAATTLAPMALKAAGGMVGKLAKGSRPNRTARPPSRKITQSPQRRPSPRIQNQHRCHCSPEPHVHLRAVSPARSASAPGIMGTLGNIGQGALGTLASLLGNKNVQQILSGLASKGISQAIKLGNSELTAREGALLNTIAYLAQEAQEATFDDQYPDAMDYLIQSNGEFIEDHETPVNRALRFLELLDNHTTNE